MLHRTTVSFLKELSKNNHKVWFDENRAAYVKAKADFETFIGAVLEKLTQLDDSLTGITSKSCMFRINRDVRFSKNKEPYKNNFGASMNRGGKKSVFAGYYFHLEPGASFMGGGLWMPMPPELAKVRQEIDYNLADFRKIIGNPIFKKTYDRLQDTGDMKLQRLPKGYESDNPAAEYLKLKSFVAMKPVSDKDLLAPELLKHSIDAYKALKPLIQFLNQGLSE
jgi:uncharacterized protein (TIGR02453 family)